VRKTLAVASRELRERWLLFPAGLIVGLVPLVLGPSVGLRPAQVPLLGLICALLLGTTAALVAGASMLARDAADGRIAFLFSRPLAWPAIWGGKWLAALVLVIGSGALATLPWMLVHPPEPPGYSWRAALLDPQGPALFVLLLLLAIGLANFNATAFRSRSAWLALDLGLLLLALWTTRHWVLPLYALGIVRRLLFGGWGLMLPVGLVALALVVASAAQVALGRTDLRRAHRAMSLVFWTIVFVGLAGTGLRLAWARAAGPSDLTVKVASYEPSGRFLYVFGGSHRGGAASFLIDTEESRFVPLGLDRPWGGVSWGMAFSGDGRSGATFAFDADATAIDLADLGGDELRFRRVELEGSPPPSGLTRLALSVSGSTVLLTHGHGASLFTVPSGRRVATATIPPGWRTATTRFLGESAARIWLIPSIGFRPPSGAEMRLLELGAERGTRTWDVALAAPLDPVRAGPAFAQPDASGRRFLSRDGGVRLRDGATGRLLATLVETTAPVSAAFLADGRIVVGEAAGARVKLHVFSDEGTPLREAMLELSPARLGVGPEVAPGRIAVHSGVGFGSHSGASLIFDVSDGRVVETLLEMRPVPRPWFVEPPARPPGTGPSTVHFFVRGGALVRVDFATGERHVVAGPGAPDTGRLPVPLREVARGSGARQTSPFSRAWIITSRARSEASSRSAARSAVSRRKAAWRTATRRGASAATRIGGRRPPRTITWEAARRATRPLPSSKGRISTMRAIARAAACSGWRSSALRAPSHVSRRASRLGISAGGAGGFPSRGRASRRKPAGPASAPCQARRASTVRGVCRSTACDARRSDPTGPGASPPAREERTSSQEARTPASSRLPRSWASSTTARRSASSIFRPTPARRAASRRSRAATLGFTCSPLCATFSILGVRGGLLEQASSGRAAATAPPA
jgi:hypothetical protein